MTALQALPGISFLHSTGEHSNGAITENGYSEGKIAAEGQLYLDRVTVEALAGVDWNSLEESFKPFIEGKFTFYPTNNFRMGAGLRYRGAFGGRTQFVGNAEYLTNLGNARSASLYGQFEVDLNDSDISSSGDYSIMAGLRFYFGGATRPGTEDRGRSLIERDREDLMPIYFTGDAGHLPPRRDKFLPPVVPPGPPDGPPGPPDGPPGPPDGPPGPPGPPSGPPGGG